MSNTDLDFETIKNEYSECNKYINYLIENKEDYSKIRNARKNLYNLEICLVSKCVDHKKIDIEYLDKHDTIKFVNEDKNGLCLICGISTYFHKPEYGSK